LSERRERSPCESVKFVTAAILTVVMAMIIANKSMYALKVVI